MEIYKYTDVQSGDVEYSADPDKYTEGCLFDRMNKQSIELLDAEDFEQPEPVQQKPVGTYGEIYHAMRDLLQSGKVVDQQVYQEMRNKPLYTSPQPAPVQGWKLVPVLATRAIEDAIGRAKNLSASEIWEDALAATPQPAQQQPIAILNHAHGVYAFRSVKLNGLPDGEYKLYTSPPAHPDSYRIDWLTNNPVDALDIFGRVKGADAVRWIRQEIDNAIASKGDA